ncbi:MAG: 6-carboxytetrahydropterin synthase, partial [Myxococcota bacterium]
MTDLGEGRAPGTFILPKGEVNPYGKVAIGTMYTITSSIYIEFGHHVRGHDGPCISIHGHTWKFEVVVAAEKLDAQ